MGDEIGEGGGGRHEWYLRAFEALSLSSSSTFWSCASPESAISEVQEEASCLFFLSTQGNVFREVQLPRRGIGYFIIKVSGTISLSHIHQAAGLEPSNFSASARGLEEGRGGVPGAEAEERRAWGEGEAFGPG